MSGVPSTDGGAAPAWDLTGLMPDGSAGARAYGERAIGLAQAFAQSHTGRVGDCDAAALAAVVAELEHIQETIGQARDFATLRFDADAEPPEHGALLAEMEEVAARVDTLVNFFELEWLDMPDERAAELLGAQPLRRYAHGLSVLRLTRPHRLTAPEERLLTEKAVTGREAWRRLLEEQLVGLEVDTGGERIDLVEAMARLSSAQRSERQAVAGAITATLGPGLRTRTSILNTLLSDHSVDDRLRRYPHWLAELNLENEASDESVQALVDAVVARYDIPRRWSECKARALGLERLSDYDRFAPVGEEPDRLSWTDARTLVLDSYRSFSPQLGAQAERFFTERWIDAAQRPGKRPDAYCAYTVPKLNPFIFLNFAGRRDDVLALAHELGHGLHFLLAAPQGLLHMDTPLTVSETASVFGETLTFAHLLSQEDDPTKRFGLIAYQLDEAVATVFRQIALHRFEAAIHRHRREEGELSPEQVGEHWLAANHELYGSSVELTPDYADWWSFVSHVFVMPGYVYAYAYGQLLALSLYARYLHEGEAFVPRYLELLAAGGSRSPEELAAIGGVDLGDPAFWDTGLGLIDDQLAAAEDALAAGTP